MYFTKTLFKVLVYVIGRNVFKNHLGLDEPFPMQEHIPVTEWHVHELLPKKDDGINADISPTQVGGTIWELI